MCNPVPVPDYGQRLDQLDHTTATICFLSECVTEPPDGGYSEEGLMGLSLIFNDAMDNLRELTEYFRTQPGRAA